MEARGAPEGERKTITALFADVAGLLPSPTTSILKRPELSSTRL